MNNRRAYPPISCLVSLWGQDDAEMWVELRPTGWRGYATHHDGSDGLRSVFEGSPRRVRIAA